MFVPGQVMYWVTFGLMTASAIAFAIMTFMRPMHQRAHGCAPSFQS